MPIGIRRHFVTIGNRQMMYRSAGHGPPVILLHQSPKSSEEHEPLIRLLADSFTVIAPDTPGFGLSEPILSDPESTLIDVFAAAIVGFMDVLGLTRAGIYGIHTGASIATRLARLYPERLHCLVANGTLIMTDDERAEMLDHYFVPFNVKWDGSHLTWLWARLREQMIFFPWYRKDPACRLSYPVPTPERLHRDSLDLLNSGDAHRIAYRGAIAYDKTGDMADIVPPTMYICAETDVLMQYAHRFPPLPPASRFVPVSTNDHIFNKTLEIFRDYVPEGSAPALPSATAIEGRLASRFVHTDAGDMRVRFADGKSGPTILLIHEMGASGASLGPWAEMLIGENPLVVLDLPGNGDSDVSDSGWSLEHSASVLEALLADITGPVEIWAIGDAAALGAEVARRVGADVARLVLCDPFLPDETETATSFAPDFRPSYEGAHITRAWMAARDRCLFWPWNDTSPEGIVRQAPIVNDEAVHQRTIDLLKASPSLDAMMKAIFAYPLAKTLAGLTLPVIALASPWLTGHLPFKARIDAAALKLVSLEGTPETWRRQI